MAALFKERGDKASTARFADYSIKVTNSTKRIPAETILFPADQYDPKGNYAFLQYLVEKGPQIKFDGFIHEPEIATNNSVENIGLIGDAESGITAEDRKEGLQGAFDIISAIGKKACTDEYRYTENDRLQLSLMKRIYSGLALAGSDIALKDLANDKKLEIASAEFEKIAKAGDAIVSALKELKPVPYEEITNIEALSYEALNNIFWQCIEGYDLKKYQYYYEKLTNKRSSDEPGKDDRLKEMRKKITALEVSGVDYYRSSLGEKIKGSREVHPGQVGFTDGEAMGVIRHFEGVALVIRAAKYQRLHGEDKTALALAVLNDDVATPKYIEAIFKQFIERNPDFEMSELEITLVGGKGNEKFAKHNARGIALPDVNDTSAETARIFHQRAGSGVLTALRVLDYAVDNKISVRSTFLFKPHQPTGFVVSAEKDGLAFTCGQPENTRANNQCAHIMLSYNLNNRMGNVAFNSANEPYTPILVTRDKFTEMLGIYKLQRGFGLYQNIVNNDKDGGIDRGATQRFLMPTLARPFAAFFVGSIYPAYEALYDKTEAAAKLAHKGNKLKVNEAANELKKQFIETIGVPVAVLGDESKFNHDGCARVIAMGGPLAKMKSGQGRKWLGFEDGQVDKYITAMNDMERRAKEYTLGDAAELYAGILKTKDLIGAGGPGR